ncbi:MAG: hypothetical protein ACREWG_13290 [Gammaproteobacteria bacterium]
MLIARRGYRMRLFSANPEFAPVEVDLRRQRLVIKGIGVGVLRKHLPAQTRPTGRA